MDPFEKPRDIQSGRTLPPVVGLSADRLERIKVLLEKRFDRAAEITGYKVATVQDSGVMALYDVFGGNVRAMARSAANCIQFAFEVQEKNIPIVIDGDLVRNTLADIKQTLTATEPAARGKLSLNASRGGWFELMKR